MMLVINTNTAFGPHASQAQGRRACRAPTLRLKSFHHKSHGTFCRRLKNFTASSLALTSLATAPHALASPTLAGTVIQNTATISYSSLTGPVTVQSNTNSVTVDQLINVAVTALQTSPIGIGAGLATLSFQVTNTGNGPDSFVLNAQPAINGNAFTTIIQTLAVDTNGNGIYNAGVDTVLANGSISPKIAPDASLKIFVLAAPPIGVPDTLRSQISLTATSVAGSGKTGSVLTGKGDNAVTAVVGLSGGTSSAQETVVASIANVILTKTLSITDQYGGTSPISGATVTYTLVVHATGSGTANAVTVADLYPAGTTYRAGTLTLNGKPLTDTSDADQGSATQTGLTVALGNLAGGAPDNTITFQTTIN